MFENWRLNPFTGIVNAVLIEDEQHTVEYHSDWNAYGIQLNEAPRLDNPSTVEIVEDVTGGSTFSELPRTQAPAASQYRVDYDALTYYGTGRVEFAAADVGKAVLVSYYRTGWTVKNRYPMGQTTIPTNLEVTEDAMVHGDLDLDGENTGGGDLHVAGDADVDGALNVDGGITGNLVGNVDGNLSGDVTGDVTGNADTADHAETAGGGIETGLDVGTMHFEIIEIGDWNMDTTASVSIPNGLTASKIRSVYAFVIIDTSNLFYPLNMSVAGSGSLLGWFAWSATEIVLERLAGGFFDSNLFDATSFNRGFITIEYID